MNQDYSENDKSNISDINKELELKIEEDYLGVVIKRIKEEILIYIEKRNKVSGSLLDYRKKALEEYKDDEDKIIEYFDHERFVEEEMYKTIDRRLREMTILQNSPYFGRVNLIDKEFDEEGKMYIGRFGMTPESEYEPLVVDWRAPIASLFYESKLGEAEYTSPSGKIPVEILSKRQYIVKNEKMLGMFDSTLDIKDEVLQMVLSKNSEEKLKDIIMTIQQEQDEIIRQSKDKTVVVDGVAGSGKTTIALHRIAYLLYNYRKTLQDKVMIFGPNNIFMEYISMVLPSLGETGVRQTTFNDFAMDILKLRNVMDLREYMEKIISGDEEFTAEVIYKTSLEYKTELDNLVEELDKDFFKAQTVKLGETIVINEKEIKDLFCEHYKHMDLFKRSKKIKRIIFCKIRDVRDDVVRQINLEYNEALKKLDKEQLELEGSFIDFNRRIKIREVIKNVIESKKNLYWIENPNVLEIYKKINGEKELTIDDLAPILYLKVKLEGLRLKEDIKHIVIDEAQDYSYLQFIVIKELLKCNYMTIVGDKNQRLIPVKDGIPMTEFKNFMGDIDVECFSLVRSYRSTGQIMNYANKFLKGNNIVPMVREGREVNTIEYGNEGQLIQTLLEQIKKLKNREYESVAVICRDLDVTKKVFDLIKDKKYIKMLDNEDMIYKGGLVIVPSYFAKGLEFDAVIFIEDNKLDEKMNKVKYVITTRALHELVVLKEK